MLKKKKIILLMFQNIKHNSSQVKTSYYFNDFNREKWYYLAVKKLSALLRGVTPKNNCDFYCLN